MTYAASPGSPGTSGPRAAGLTSSTSTVPAPVSDAVPSRAAEVTTALTAASSAMNRNRSPG